MAGEPEALLDLGAGDEGALALASIDALLGLEPLQGVADGRPRDAVGGAELTLGGEAGAFGQVADQLEQGAAEPPRLRLSPCVLLRAYPVGHLSLRSAGVARRLPPASRSVAQARAATCR